MSCSVLDVEEWPAELRRSWVLVRVRRVGRRARRHLHLRGGRFREWLDVGGEA